jgi:tetratricopeptide (TPR) repeat protein
MNDKPAAVHMVSVCVVILMILLMPPLAAANLNGQEVESAIEEGGRLTREQKIKRAKQYYIAAEQFLKEENYTAADDALKKAQELLTGISPAEMLSGVKKSPPEEIISLAQKAWSLSRSGKSAEAIAYYIEAIKVDPRNLDLYHNLAIEYLNTGQLNEALQVFQQILTLDPQDKDANYNLGVLYDTYFGDKKKAITYYRKYIKLVPRADDALAVNNWIEEIQKHLIYNE